jgi:hypothetical protein
MRHALRLFFLLSLGLARRAPAQPSTLYFPPTTGNTWATTTPDSLGWCQTPLDSLLAYAGRQHTNALLLLKDGRLVVEYCRPTATVSPLASASFRAFPNPTTGFLALRQPFGTATVRLLDALGHEVSRQNTPALETTVSVAALAPGLYTAQWLDGSGRLLASRKVARAL